MGNPVRNDFITIDIGRMSATIHRSFVCHTIGEGDNEVDRYGVRVLNNGQEFNLSGCTCVGYFIRPDGNTIVINGEINGNEASVTVPEACYAYTGSFSLSIKIGGTDFLGTMRIVDGTIVDTTTSTFVDPGNVIPDLADWIALIEDADEAATDIGKLHIENEQIEGTRYKIKVYKDS